MAKQSIASKENKKIRQDIRVLSDLTEIYCRQNHTGNKKHPLEPRGVLAEYADVLKVKLCPECSKLVLHGASKRIQCPMDPKPACKHCPKHCYQTKYREQVREVMRFSWRYLIRKGRFDLIARYM
ncbi:MAG: hypothetical protein COT35_06850 [Nitrospirae bacterium CG08_land_8_20_14_0_20_52_24]|nr:MAG: hypothetical protein COT35_06850 [Nitrospirae bacterium CG08_land_8_20_14_0_20_52_24]PIV82443.1 MAG: hypothetical protein COW52_13560 [Nitrospirae bacterium CG17_big_fil_post_rev_8_21_14_2_50_50_9]PIX86563.1 MAG: hypothetical protein COZ32_02645 [Nitrospirae bacterium CG_4_10_14_3_um_filter_53_41]